MAASDADAKILLPMHGKRYGVLVRTFMPRARAVVAFFDLHYFLRFAIFQMHSSEGHGQKSGVQRSGFLSRLQLLTA